MANSIPMHVRIRSSYFLGLGSGLGGQEYLLQNGEALLQFNCLDGIATLRASIAQDQMSVPL